MDFYDFHDMLSGPSSEYETLDNVHFYSYIFRMNYNSEDRWFSPRAAHASMPDTATTQTTS